MIYKVKDLLKSEKGAVEIVEAALIYPIVIFVVIIFFFLGNVFFQQAKVDAIAVRAANKAVTYYTNPLLRSGSLPTNAEKVNLDPYRYLLEDASVSESIEKFIKTELKNAGSGAFTGMEIRPKEVSCEIHNYVVYQTISVKIQYSIELLPMELIDGASLLNQSVATATSASDPAEFIRNIDMILDYADITGLTDKIKSTVDQFF